MDSFKRSLDKYLTDFPNDGFDEWVEVISDKIDENIFNRYENIILNNIESKEYNDFLNIIYNPYLDFNISTNDETVKKIEHFLCTNKEVNDLLVKNELEKFVDYLRYDTNQDTFYVFDHTNQAIENYFKNKKEL